MPSSTRSATRKQSPLRMGANLGALRGASGRRAAPSAPAAECSVELGRRNWGPDYLERNDVPSGGVLFSMWTRIPNLVRAYPTTLGNMEVFNLYGSNWNLRCVANNIDAQAADNCIYNANSMLIADGTAIGQPNGTWLGDFSYLQDLALPVARVNGWVFVAWQVIVGASDFTVRQWIRYAGQPVQGPYASTISFTQLRSWAEENGWAPGSAAAWTPSAPTRFTIGTVNDNCRGFYTRARMESNSSLPANAYIESLSSASGADTSAWGDWQLTWDTDANTAVLADRSGHGRTLSTHSGGVLYQGPYRIGEITDLDATKGGNFVRSTEASYTTPSTDVPVGWAPKNRRRVDWGTGYPMVWLEDAATNEMLSTEDLLRGGGGWVMGTASRLSDVILSPDGAFDKTRVQNGSGATGANYILTTIPSNADWIAGAWHRAPAGTPSMQDMIGGSLVYPCTRSGTIGTSWVRDSMKAHPANAFPQMAYWIAEGRDWTAYGGTAAGARDQCTWGLQLIQGTVDHKYIRTEGLGYGAATCDADLLSYPMGAIPDKMISGAFTFYVALSDVQANIVRKGGSQVLLSYAEDASETIEFYVASGSLYIRVVSGGVEKVRTAALTLSGRTAVTVNDAAGTIAIAGAAAGNGTVTGTSWLRAPGPTLYLGSLADGSNHAHAGLWFGASTPTVSTSKYVIFTLGQSNMTQHGMHDRVQSWMQEYHPNTKLIDGSMGATTLATDWNPSTGAQYEAAVAAWNAAAAADPTLSTYTPIVIWVHGEGDAANGAYATAYGSNLAALRTALQTDIPQLAGCRWVVGQLSTNTSTAFGATTTTIGQVRSGQAAFVASLGTKGAIVDPSDLTFDPSPPNLHFDNDSIHEYARRVVAAARTLGV